MRRIFLVLFVVSLFGCTQKSAPEAPSLISFADRQRSRIDPAIGSGKFGSIADQLAAMPQRVFKGTEVVIDETFLNEGKPSSGLRAIVKGTAMALFTPPGTLTFRATNAAGTVSESTVPLTLTPVGYEATSNSIEYGKEFDVSFQTTGKKGGDGSLQILVYPLDSKGKSSAVVDKLFSVQDDGSEEAPADSVPE